MYDKAERGDSRVYIWRHFLRFETDLSVPDKRTPVARAVDDAQHLHLAFRYAVEDQVVAMDPLADLVATEDGSDRKAGRMCDNEAQAPRSSAE